MYPPTELKLSLGLLARFGLIEGRSRLNLIKALRCFVWAKNDYPVEKWPNEREITDYAFDFPH